MTVAIANYTILTEPPPEHYRFTHEPLLYHRNDYLQCQERSPDYSFWICQPQNDGIEGVIHFHVQENKAISQLYSPFGSYQGVKLSDAVAGQLISVLLQRLVENGVREIEINQPPQIYDSYKWGRCLRKAGFEVAHTTINHHLLVDDQSLEDKMHLMEQRKLARCSDFEFHISPIGSLPVVYQFIEACRKERGQSLSMTYRRLERVVSNLPHEFLLCRVEHGKKWAAAAIIVKVSSSCWYQFYPAHSREFNRESPLVYLISELYAYAAGKGVRYIDLGTSELEGTPIEGLMTFKKRIGGIPGRKTTYSKIL